MKTDRYGQRPVVSPGDEREFIPTVVFDLSTGKTFDTYRTKTQAVKVVKQLNQALREEE